MDFCKKWRLGVPIPPKKPFETLKKEVKKAVNKTSLIIPTYKRSSEQIAKDKELYTKILLHTMITPDEHFIPPVTGWEKFLFNDTPEMESGKDKDDLLFRNHGEIKFTVNFNHSQNVIMPALERLVKFFKEKYELLNEDDKDIYQSFENDIRAYEKKINISRKSPSKEDEKDYKRTKSYLRKLKTQIKNRSAAETRIEAQRIIPRPTRQFNHYDDYLRVWDLFQKIGNKWTRIGNEALDDVSSENAKRKAIEYYRLAESLINDMSIPPR